MSAAQPDDELLFLPLGGTGEIGMNLNLYGHQGRWLMVDLGVTFSRDNMPGVEVILPNPAFIEERREQLDGLVLTHAHEDHIGAVGYLWDRLGCPIYATPFTAEVLRPKLAEVGLLDIAEITEVPLSGRFSVGPFEIELITLTHSIPEPNAVVIRTAAGTVLHTGDWKLDPEPVVGEDFDEEALRALADERVLAMVCDSTNALVEGDSGSEGDVAESLAEIIGEQRGRVAVACFASNVARLESVMRAAAQHGRRVVLAGRSMRRIVDAARATGYLEGLPPLISEKDVGFLPREEVLILCTGSQGEPRAALWRIVRDDHPDIVLEEGDSVIFSSREIPGNETAIHELQNALVRQGVQVIGDGVRRTHVSGHPARDELAQMYGWVRPQVAVPVHGEARHLFEHAALARSCQVPQAIVGENGSLIRLAPGRAEIVDSVPAGRLALDGRRILAPDSPVLRSRKRMIYNGAATAVVLLDERGHLYDAPRLVVQGLIDPEHEAEIADAAVAAAEQAIERLPLRARDDSRVAEVAVSAIRKVFLKAVGKKPVTEVEVIRLS